MAAPVWHHKSGMAMPSLALGTWRTDNALLYDAVRAAIRVGYRHIDCAPIYQNQHIIGKAIVDAIAAGEVTRDELFLVSKLASTECDPEHVMPAFEQTLKDLQTDYLDLYLIHWPQRYRHNPSKFPVPLVERLGYSPEAVAQTWRVLEQLHTRRQVRALGVSNFTSTKLNALLEHAVVLPVCNQVELHPYFPQTELLAWCKSHDIYVTAYCPLGSPARPENFRSGGEPIDVLHSPVIAKIAERQGRSPAQVLIRWALQRGTVPLPKSVTPSRISENFNVFDFELSESDMADIAALSCGCRYFKGANMLREGESLSELWDEVSSE